MQPGASYLALACTQYPHPDPAGRLTIDVRIDARAIYYLDIVPSSRHHLRPTKQHISNGHSTRSKHLLASSSFGMKAIRSTAYRTNWPTSNSPSASGPENEVVKSIELARADLEEWKLSSRGYGCKAMESANKKHPDLTPARFRREAFRERPPFAQTPVIIRINWKSSL